MEVRLEKLPLFQKLFDQGIKPNSENFIKVLVSMIKEKIAAKVDIKYVSEETFAKVDQIAKNFKTITKGDWTTKKVFKNLFIRVCIKKKFTCVAGKD